MLAALFITLIVVCALCVGVAMVIGLAVRLLFGLILLPFRLLGWLLFLPLLLVKVLFGLFTGLIGLFAGIIVVPVLLLSAASCSPSLFATVAVPLLPIAAVALLVWVLVRASRPRPSDITSSHASPRADAAPPARRACRPAPTGVRSAACRATLS